MLIFLQDDFGELQEIADLSEELDNARKEFPNDTEETLRALAIDQLLETIKVEVLGYLQMLDEIRAEVDEEDEAEQCE